MLGALMPWRLRKAWCWAFGHARPIALPDAHNDVYQWCYRCTERIG